MLANKIVELFLVVVQSLMIAHAENCNSVKTCLKNYASKFNVKQSIISIDGLSKVYEAVCNNKDAFATCYNAQYKGDCSKLSGNESDLKNSLTNACERKVDISETNECIRKSPTASKEIAECANKIKEDICSISEYIGCIESAMKDKCQEKNGLFKGIKSRLSFCDAETVQNVESTTKKPLQDKQPEEKTVDGVKSANKNQCAVFCSGSKILLLLCFLLFLIHIV